MDAVALRRVLGQFATGVTVVTAADASDYACVTVNSFSSVSLGPPLVLFSLHQASELLNSFEHASRIGISILERGNKDVSRLFAGKERHRWKECGVETNENGTLFVSGSIARLECERWATYDGGDHRIFVCKVLSIEQTDHGRPLVFFRGAYWDLDETVA